MSTLYGAPLSPYVRKVAIFLEEKGLAYEWKMVRPHNDDPEFKTCSPLGKIPGYSDDKIKLADSSAICQYLDRIHPSHALYPADAVQFARTLWFEEFFDTEMIVPLRAVFTYGYANEKFFNKPRNEEKLEQGKKDAIPFLQYVESQLTMGKWVLGESFSMADIALVVGWPNVELAGYSLDAKAYPKFADLCERAQNRPSFKNVAKKMDDFIRSL